MLVESSAKFEEVKIPLREPVGGLEAVSAVLGVPQWWPTGSRVSVVIAHGSSRTMDDPMIEYLHRELTERRYMTLRFNFPFAELKKRRPDPLRVLVQAFRSAVSLLGRDPTAAPAHLFVGGSGLGSQAAVQLATQRLRIDGVFALGFPLHPADKAERVQAESLFRIIAPLLFLQGTRDRSCDLDALRRTLVRIGAPTALHVIDQADSRFKIPKRTGRTEQEVWAELLGRIDAWIQKLVGA